MNAQDTKKSELIATIKSLDPELLDSVPQVAALKGRIQPVKFHPEGDAFVHTVLCLKRGVELGATDDELVAILCHDFGKAVTPDDNLPHHYDHERLGVPIVQDFCCHYGISGYARELAVVCCRYHLHVHRIDRLRRITISRMLRRIGPVRELITGLGFVAQCDAQGRGPKHRTKRYPQRQRLYEEAAKHFEW